MTKNYSYPRVTLSTTAKKHSPAFAEMPDTTIMFAALVTEKGPDDRVIKIHTLSEFIDTFGSFDEKFYNLNGQMALNVYNWLSNGGTLLVKRLVGTAGYSSVPDSGQTVTNTIANIQFKRDSKVVSTTAAKIVDINLILDSMSTDEKLSLQLKSNNIFIATNSLRVLTESDAVTDLFEINVIEAITVGDFSYLNESSKLPISTLLVQKKEANGVFKYYLYDKSSITGLSTVTTKDNSKDVLAYDFVTKTFQAGTSNAITFKDGSNKDISPILQVTIGETRVEKISSKYRGSFYNKLILSCEVLSQSGDGLYNFYVKKENSAGKLEILEKFLHRTKNNYLAALAGSEYVKVSNIPLTESADYVLGNSNTIEGGASIDSILTYSDTIDALKDFWCSTHTSADSHNDCATRYLSNALETPIDIVLDAGYPSDIKTAIINFVAGENSVRSDIIAILDCYELKDALRLATPENRVTFTTTSSNIAVYDQFFTILDEIFTSQHIYVTPTYFLSKLISYNDQKYGIQYPTAGLNRGILDDALYISKNPTADEKDSLFEARINYAEKSSREIAFMTQRTYDGSSKYEYTALSFLNNQRVLEKIKKDIEAIGRKYLYEFNDATTISNMTSALNKYLAGWISNRTLNLGTAVVEADDVYETAINISVNIRFVNTIEVINVDIVIE